MPTYGQRPQDVVQDSKGTALRGVTLYFYQTEGDAADDVGSVGSATSDVRGRWSFTAAAGELWARLPDGTTWQISSPENLEDYLNITEGDARYYTKAAADAATTVAIQDAASDTTAALALKSDVGHAHDSRYYTEAETDVLLAAKAGTATVDALDTRVDALEAESGVPAGGATGQVLSKASAADGDVEWSSISAAGGAAVFDVVDYGAAVDGTTDDTAAWQAALDAAGAAGGGVVTSSVAGVSLIGGALQDTGAANAQLILPDVHALDDPQIGITIRGPFEQSASNSVVGAAVVPTSGLVLESTLAAGTGAVIGAYGSGTSYLNFTFLHFAAQNVTIRTVDNPTITGLDLRRVNSCHLQNVVVDTGAYSSGALVEPTTATSFGIRLPKLNNGAHIRLEQVDVFGFYTGIEFSEHASFDEVAVGGCNTGMVAVAANHPSHFRRVLFGYCKYGLRFTGAHALDIEQWACEHATSGWYQTAYDIDDASNYGDGFVRWWAVQQGVGPHDSFVINGGSGITESRIGDPIGTSGGSTVYVYRDRLVADAGDSILTLGASPVANSPLVWVNDVIQWPTTDYTIADDVVTFNSGLNISDVLLVQYHSTASSAAASTLTAAGVNIVDTFDRGNTATPLGTTSDGTEAWTAQTGTWGINSNKAYVSTGLAAQTCKAVIDCPAADATVAVTVSGTGTGGLTIRSDGAGNEYVVEIQVAASYAPKIYKGTGGTYSTIATGAATTVAAGSVLSVTMSGDSITVKDDGVTIVSVSDSSYNTNTRHGLYATAPAGSGSPFRFDNFSITS